MSEVSNFPPPLTRRDLDVLECPEPGCTNDHDTMALFAGCHPEAGMFAQYNKRTGTLVLQCRLCGGGCAAIAVSPGVLQ